MVEIEHSQQKLGSGIEGRGNNNLEYVLIYCYFAIIFAVQRGDCKIKLKQ